MAQKKTANTAFTQSDSGHLYFLDVSKPLQINTEVNFLTDITNDTKERQSKVKKPNNTKHTNTLLRNEN